MANTTNFGWETPDDTDLVKDGAAAMRTLGNSIDASFVDLKGGTTGQILSKNSNTDLDYVWINNDQGDITAVTAGTGLTGGGTAGAITLTNDMATTITAAGDIVVGTGSGTYDNLPIGTTGQILTADTTVTPYKVKWAAPSPAKVLQIVSTTIAASRSTTSATFVDISGASASITPTATTSKILVYANAPAFASQSSGGGTCYGAINTVRGSTEINRVTSGWYISGGTGGQAIGDLYAPITMITMDEPATTSSTTYKLQFRLSAGTTFYASGSSSEKITLVLVEVGI